MLFGFAVVVAAMGLAIFAWANRYGRLEPYTDAAGRPVVGSISETRRLTFGGAPQWITLRGPSANAPILIWLSGGPGLDETFMLRRFNGALEQHYLVAYWVQRGAGRSFDGRLDPSAMRIGQFVSDLDELVTYLTQRFGQRQVILVGHSWGTVIGVEYVAAHPKRVAAYVGVGQVADMAENERAGYAFAVGEAEKRGDSKALAALRRIGPPPYPVESMLVQRKYLASYGGAFHQPLSMPQMILWSLETSRGAWLDLVKFGPGQTFSLRTLWPQVAELNFIRNRPRLETPVAIFAGRYDRQISADLAHSYFEKLNAPAKRFVWFEHSAHSPQFEEPERFNATLLEVLSSLLTTSAPPTASVRAGGHAP